MSDPTQPPPADERPQTPAGTSPYGEQPAAPPPPTYAQPPNQPYGQPPTYTQPPNQPYGQQPGYLGQPVPPGALTPDEITWGGAAHWSALVASLVGLSFLGPLLVMLTKGNESPYVRRQAVESLNFQLSILIYAIVSAVLVLLLIGILMLLVVGVAWFVLTIIASVRASRGEEYRYPMTIRMVS